MRVTVAESVNHQIAEEARFWRTHATKEVAERLVRNIRSAINTLANGLQGNKVDGLAANSSVCGPVSTLRSTCIIMLTRRRKKYLSFYCAMPANVL